MNSLKMHFTTESQITKAARRILVLILKTSVISLWPLWLCGKKKSQTPSHIEAAKGAQEIIKFIDERGWSDSFKG